MTGPNESSYVIFKMGESSTQLNIYSYRYIFLKIRKTFSFSTPFKLVVSILAGFPGR